MSNNETNIILLGGTGCTGKTALAHSIMCRFAMPYLALDYLMMGLYRSQSDCGFSPDDSDQHIASKMWPTVQAMIMTGIENRHSSTYEGIQLQPSTMRQFDERYLPFIIPLCIGFSERYVELEFSGAIRDNRNRIEQRQFGSENLANMVEKNRIMKEQCGLYDVPYFEVDYHYGQTIQAALSYIERKLAPPKNSSES